MLTDNLTKFAAVMTLSAGLVAAGAGSSRAGELDPLFGALIGGGLGSGVGYAAGKSKGAAIGGLLGLGIGALVATAIDDNDRKRRRHYNDYSYAPPPPPPAYGYEAPQYYEPSYGYNGGYYAPAPYHTAQTCQPYNSTFTVNGVRQRSTGTACLQPDGTWRAIN